MLQTTIGGRIILYIIMNPILVKLDVWSVLSNGISINVNLLLVFTNISRSLFL